MTNFPETSLEFSLPEELGILDNVWVHVRLSDGREVHIKATHEFRYHSSGKEWPTIFSDSNLPIINWSIADDNEKNSSLFGIVFTCFDKAYAKGSFNISFTAWKNESLKTYYTETRSYAIDLEDDEDF